MWFFFLTAKRDDLDYDNGECLKKLARFGF